jgi:hypothetical protein
VSGAPESNLLTELDDSEDGCAALFVPAGLPAAVRAALLLIIGKQIAEARRERPQLEAHLRYGAAVERPEVEMIYLVVDPTVD